MGTSPPNFIGECNCNTICFFNDANTFWNAGDVTAGVKGADVNNEKSDTGMGNSQTEIDSKEANNVSRIAFRIVTPSFPFYNDT